MRARRAVAGHEPRHQEHRVVGARTVRDGVRRGRAARAGPPPPARSDRPRRPRVPRRARPGPAGGRSRPGAGSRRVWSCSQSANVAPEVTRTRDLAAFRPHRGDGPLPSHPVRVDWRHVAAHALAPGTQDARGRDVVVSEELFAPVSPGIELCYQTFGSPDGDPLLLVMGLGGPMTWWDADLCERARPRRLLRHPLRQPRHRPLHARSAPGCARAQLVRAFTTGRVRAPYSLDDMAGRRPRPARPPRHRVGARRRRLDGRHDRADDGDARRRRGCGR